MLANRPKNKILVDGGDPESARTRRVTATFTCWPPASGLDHLLACFALDAELVTVPAKILEEWGAKGFPLPQPGFNYKAVDRKGRNLKPIPYKELDLSSPWERFDIAHELTRKDIEKFVADYESTLQRTA